MADKDELNAIDQSKSEEFSKPFQDDEEDSIDMEDPYLEDDYFELDGKKIDKDEFIKLLDEKKKKMTKILSSMNKNKEEDDPFLDISLKKKKTYQYSPFGSGSMKDTFLNKKEIPEEYKNFEVTTDGLDYEIYSSLPYSVKLKHKSLKQCGFCNKLFPEFVTVPYDMNQVCWHCIFFLNSSNLDKIEEMYQISVQSYLDFCGPAHKTNDCIRPDSCLLCISGLGLSFSDLNNVEEDPNKMVKFIDMVENGNTDVILQNEYDIILDI